MYLIQICQVKRARHLKLKPDLFNSQIKNLDLSPIKIRLDSLDLDWVGPNS